MKNTLLNDVDTKAIDKLINKYTGKPGALLGVLEETQRLSLSQFLPRETLVHIARGMDVPLSRIYSVVTFYAFFNLKPQGEHTIVVCRGTACHTRRSRNLLEHLKKLLDFSGDSMGADESEKVFLTTKDNKFTLKTVACFGQCALAPVVEIDGCIHSHMTEHKLTQLIRKVTKKRKSS